MRALHVLVLCLALRPDQEQKPPPPDASAQSAAEKTIREVFKAEYAKTAPKDRQVLAKKLLEQGRGTTDDAAVRFVLFREARDLAAQVGDAEVSLQAIDDMGSSFAIDGPAMKNATLAIVSRSAQSPPSGALARLYLRVADEATAGDSYEIAAAALTAAAAQAKRTKDAQLAANIGTRQRELNDLKTRYQAVRKARDTLKTNPDDAEAHLVVGRYLCFVKSSWDAGLGHLRKGSDATLRDLAEKEAVPPSDPSGRAALGDAWWSLSEGESGAARSVLRGRAVHWYQVAVDSLDGLTRRKAEKRIIEWKKERGGGWEDVSDPALWGLPGPKGQPFEIDPKPQPGKEVPLRPFPLGEFDAISVRFRFGSNRAARCCIMPEVNRWIVCVSGTDDTVFNNTCDGTKWTIEAGTSVPKQDEYALMLAVAGGEYIVSVDGIEKFRRKTATAGITQAVLHIEFDRVFIHEVKLRYKK